MNEDWGNGVVFRLWRVFLIPKLRVLARKASGSAL